MMLKTTLLMPRPTRHPRRRPTRSITRLGAIASIVVVASGCASSSSSSKQPSSSPASQASPLRPAPAFVPTGPISRETWTFESKPGVVFSSTNYRLFTTSDSPLLIARLPSFLEAALIQYRAILGPLPPPPGSMETYVLGTRPQWARFTQRLMGPQAEAFLRIQRGGFTTRGLSVLYDVGARDTFSLAAHEGWHQYTQRTFAQPLPVFLEEGIATFMEGYRWDQQQPDSALFWPWANSERFEQLRSAHTSKTLMPLSRLLTTSPQELLAGQLQPSARIWLQPGSNQPGSMLSAGESRPPGVDRATDNALTFYAQVWALVHFLHEGENGKYRDALAATLADAAAGKLQQRLIRQGGAEGAELANGYMIPRRGLAFLKITMNTDIETLQREYDKFIDRVVSPGSKDRITRGGSPFDPDR
jgi:hypothetical protein